MHAVVMDSLEEYLSGTLKPAVQRDIEAHLSSCESCREEIQSMQDVSHLLVIPAVRRSSRPSPGFFAGVMRQVGERQAVPSFAASLRSIWPSGGGWCSLR